MYAHLSHAQHTQCTVNTLEKEYQPGTGRVLENVGVAAGLVNAGAG